MKKALVVLLTGAMMMASVACGGGNASQPAPEAKEEAAEEAVEETAEETTDEGQAAEAEAGAGSEEVEMNVPEEPMSHADYMAAEVDTEVVIAGYIQGIQKMSEGEDQTFTNVYLQDENGGYFVYQLECTPKEYELLEVGKKLKLKGYKSEWSGEIEVTDAVWQFEDGEWKAEPEDVTALLGTEDLAAKQNMLVSFKGMTVESAGKNDAGEDVPYLYNWDGSGTEGDDLYFNVSLNGQTYSFTVESDLCAADSEVYAAVKNLKIGDVVDMEGFLYWYEGPNPHITKVTVQ